MMARPFFIWEFNQNSSPHNITDILSAGVIGGYWVLLDSFETCPIGIVSLITQLFFTIRRSILFGNSALDFGIKITDSKDISDDFSIMLNFSIIQNSSGMKYESLPSTLLSYFRTVSMVAPDLQHLVRSYLILMGESTA